MSSWQIQTICWPGRCLQRRVDAAVAGTDAVEPGQLALALQQPGDQRPGLGRIVVALDRREQLQERMLGGDHLLEAEQALGVIAQAPAAKDDADAPRPRPNEAAEQGGRGAPGRDVVDADEAAAP